jgi:tRNA(adenine34) deaminase
MPATSRDHHWMQYAITLAHKARQADEVPVGAVLVLEDQIIGEGWNQPIALHDPSAHAEIMALRAAARTIQNYRLLNTTLYTTLEPCGMCAVALVHARIQRLVFGASDPKAGAVGSVCHLLDMTHVNHHIEVLGGVESTSCARLLTDFFKAKRVGTIEQ